MTGYNLARVRRGDVFDLNALLAGSEGTLGVTTEAVLKLTPIPTHRQLVVLKYASFEAALASAEELVASDPGAIETIDETVLTLARKDVIWHAVGPILGNDPATKCVNLVEYEGSDAEQVMAKAEALRAHDTAIGVVFAADDAETAALWSLRKKGVGLLGNKEGRRQPIAFVEDTVVPPENLRAYVREFRAILDEYGLYYGMFGHIDVGCLHVRPALDMTDPEDAKLLRVISDRVVDVVQKYGGVIWGEHGKGLRSEYNPRFFGETLYGSLCRIKAAFDPHNQLNPGKLAVPPGADRALMTIESPTRGERDREIREDAREPFDRAVACNGNGQCFHWDADHVMCPSYKVTRSRVHSPKGRAGIIREWLRQLSVAGADPASELDRRRSVLDAPARWWHRLRGGYDYSHEVFEAMDGCFTCKACATQCPIRVDVPELRSRFLTLYHRRYPRPLRDWLVAGLEGLLPVMARTARLANVVNDSRLGRWLLRKIVGLVDTPRLSVPTAAEGLQARGISFGLDPTAIDEQTVLLLPDAFTTFYEADVLLAAIDVLRGLGYRVQLLDYVPSGKALHVKGFRRRFLASAARSAERLKALSAHGAPILGLDPAVTLYWREEVVDAIGERGYRVHLLQEWLAEQAHEVRLRDESPYTLYGHCAERTSVPGSDRLWAKVFEGLGLQLRPERVGCCGMCGVFGHEARHHEESRRAFELSWAARLPTTEDGRRRALATGHSCRSQTKRFAGFRPRHPLEALAELMRTDPDEQR